MASTYSDLKIELIGTGEQTGTWGSTTNNNLSVALGEAITGSADVAFSSVDITVTLTDTNAAQIARNLRLNLTGTSGGARQLILGSGCQIEKLYLVNNGLADAVTVKNTSGTGIAVPAGKTMFVYNNGTNVVDAITHLSSLTLGAALPITSGGTGQTTASAAFNALSPITTAGDLILGNGSNSATRLGIGSNGFVLTSNGTTATWAASTGGVTSFSAGTTGFTPSTNTTGAITLSGTLIAVNGGTGQTSYAVGDLLFASTTTALSKLADVATGNALISGGVGVAPSYGKIGLTTHISGTLAVGNGGTGLTTLTANNVILGNGSSSPSFVAPSTTGNVLTSNGTTWVSSAPAASGVSKAQAIAYSMTLGF
jgi:hypothetical protein